MMNYAYIITYDELYIYTQLHMMNFIYIYHIHMYTSGYKCVHSQVEVLEIWGEKNLIITVWGG